MYCLLKWIKFSVKKTKHKKNTGKLEKILEKSGNFVIPEKWEPCTKLSVKFIWAHCFDIFILLNYVLLPRHVVTIL